MASAQEARLVQRLKDKDPAAMDELVDAYSGKIFNLSIGLLKKEEDAEDVVQDTLLQVFEKINTFREEAALSSWMYRIALNFSYMKLRKIKRDDYTPLEEYLPKFRSDGMHSMPVQNWAEKGETTLLRKELGEILKDSINSLSEKYRIVLQLRDIDGFSTEEVANITGMTVPAVKSRLHRARLFLREKISTYYRD
ncbi:MAG: sigma-70 family RNA polymerase sigma factor [Proteobacteria bacterium]|nr:sigma-70 family RNA polymerase sigma factor [Pseudomonadota bacterium]